MKFDGPILTRPLWCLAGDHAIYDIWDDAVKGGILLHVTLCMFRQERERGREGSPQSRLCLNLSIFPKIIYSEHHII